MIKLVPWNKIPLEHDDVPVAIISLADGGERRQNLINRGFTPALVNDFWPACDMRNLSDSKLRSHKQCSDIELIYGRPPLPAELGCFFSHGAIMKWLANQDEVSQAIVFEDDVIIPEDDSLETLSRISGYFLQFAKLGHPFICHLGPRPEQWSSAFVRRVTRSGYFESSRIGLYELKDKKTRLWRAHAYIISKAAAKSYTELASQTGFLADDWRYISDNTRSKMVLASPPLFTQDEEVKSSIDPDNKRFLTNRAIENKLSLSPSLRTTILRYSKKLPIFIKNTVKKLMLKGYRCLPVKSLY